MYVVATAGHVDHGKSTLVEAITGVDPDRLEEEHRRGLSIELGYCWTRLPDCPGTGEVAFVDVPGHERFVPTMLAGVGPVPAVLFAVAADDDWMPQAAEHLAALDALGVRHGVLAVTRADLADPAPMAGRARAELGRTTLADAAIVPVSARTGTGMGDLQRALVAMLRDLPRPDPAADVRLWVDRCFGVHGAGTVVTGTLGAGTIATGDVLGHGDERVRVRGMQALGRDVESAGGVARVALRLGGGVPASLDRGSVLVTPDAWHDTRVLDVRTVGAQAPPQNPVLHVGAAAIGCHYRPLGPGLGRVTLQRPAPLRVADRALLRDPGSGRIWGLVVLDPAPPSLRRRGAAGARAARLARVTRLPDLADELDRRGCAEASMLRRIGVPTTAADDDVAVRADGWLLDRRRVPVLARRLREAVEEHRRREPLAPGLPVTAAARTLDLPTPALLPAVLPDGLRLDAGVVRPTAAEPALPEELERALRALAEDLRAQPFRAPDARRMAALGLHRRAVAAAERAGRLLRISDTVVLAPGADVHAAARLRALPQPFTTSQARAHLGTTRRVVLPLLELLDQRGLTTRLPDDRRRVTGHGRDSGG